MLIDPDVTLVFLQQCRNIVAEWIALQCGMYEWQIHEEPIIDDDPSA